MNKLKTMDLIGRNYLQLNFVFDRLTAYVMTDTPSLTYEVLGSQWGGVLSLWLGLSAMTVFELAELTYVIVLAGIHALKDKMSRTGQFDQIDVSKL